MRETSTVATVETLCVNNRVSLLATTAIETGMVRTAVNASTGSTAQHPGTNVCWIDRLLQLTVQAAHNGSETETREAHSSQDVQADVQEQLLHHDEDECGNGEVQQVLHGLLQEPLNAGLWAVNYEDVTRSSAVRRPLIERTM